MCVSKPRLSQARVCNWFVFLDGRVSTWTFVIVCLCVCVFSVVGPNRHQMAPNPEASSCYSQQLHVCHPHLSLVFCLVLPYRWSYAFPSYYRSRVCPYVLSSLATFGKMATKAPTSFPSNSSARIRKTWTFLYSYMLQKSLNLSLQTQKIWCSVVKNTFCLSDGLQGFHQHIYKRWMQHHDAITLVLHYWHLLISAKHQAKTHLTKRSDVSKSTNNTRQRWVSCLRWHTCQTKLV